VCSLSPSSFHQSFKKTNLDMAASEIEALHRAAGDVYPLGSTTLTELSGGLKSGDVINLVGPAASGKTEVSASP